ncbi:MAG: phage scaffolding protein, partial [Gemmatimonadaceae bacterium]|nr:phage scaffolding protein [Gemmatimonadaceae bacterium]
QTELEKLQKKLADATAANEQLTAKTKEAQQRAAFTAKATALGVRADAIDAAYILSNKQLLTFGDDGTVQGVDGAIEVLKASSPFLFGKANGAPAGTPNLNGGAGGDTPPPIASTPAQVDMAKKLGVDLTKEPVKK